ncbi:hypothetical protein [uncultured Helicobacter sp.]|uniref:hypothetical protein n=1 Tax=uncultured Helicobacter sp. TaxID=175537 RepID=UPI003752AC8E
MKKLIAFIIAGILGVGALWADEEATQDSQNTQNAQSIQNTQSTDTFQPYVKKKKKSKNVSGVFAGFGIENHSWTHSVDIYNDEQKGSNILPKPQLGIMLGGFEAGLAYYTSTIQPTNGWINYQNDIVLKVGYTYTFLTL